MGTDSGFKTRMLRAIHAEAKKRGLDHDALHDLCVARCGVGSMSEMTGQQLHSLYHQWTGKALRRRAPLPTNKPVEDGQMIGTEELITLAQEFAKRDWGPETQANFTKRQLRGRSKIRTRGDWTKVLQGIRALNKRDPKLLSGGTEP